MRKKNLGKLIFKGTLPGYHFQDVFRIFLASANASASQNLCVGFNFDAEQVCQKKIFKIPKFPIISELGLSPTNRNLKKELRKIRDGPRILRFFYGIKQEFAEI